MRAEATVVSTNKFTKNLAELTRSADVLVAAAGVPGLIRGDMVKPGAVVVDVGINRVTGPDGKSLTVGDVAFEEARRRRLDFTRSRRCWPHDRRDASAEHGRRCAALRVTPRCERG